MGNSYSVDYMDTSNFDNVGTEFTPIQHDLIWNYFVGGIGTSRSVKDRFEFLKCIFKRNNGIQIFKLMLDDDKYRGYFGHKCESRMLDTDGKKKKLSLKIVHYMLKNPNYHGVLHNLYTNNLDFKDHYRHIVEEYIYKQINNHNKTMIEMIISYSNLCSEIFFNICKIKELIKFCDQDNGRAESIEIKELLKILYLKTINTKELV